MSWGRDRDYPFDVEVLEVVLPDGTVESVRVEMNGDNVRISSDDYKKIKPLLVKKLDERAKLLVNAR